ncbi:hypothetical protein BDV32DRAFT_116409 [Aspergillus pseudonomiae]|nr:hypothetical protein BDV32DRAFT_116409 [Aspergillus pseudonomiae]
MSALRIARFIVVSQSCINGVLCPYASMSRTCGHYIPEIDPCYQTAFWGYLSIFWVTMIHVLFGKCGDGTYAPYLGLWASYGP